VTHSPRTFSTIDQNPLTPSSHPSYWGFCFSHPID